MDVRTLTMKKNLFITLVVSLFISCKTQEVTPANQEEHTIEPNVTKTLLMIGNSYSRSNGMLEKLELMAISTGDSILIDSSLLYAGARIVNHAKTDNVYDKISSKNWDYVSLQTHSQESAFSQEHIDTIVFPSISNLVDKIYDNNAVPIFYRTWAYKNVNQTLCDSLTNFCSYESMDSLNHARTLYFAKQLSGEVAPVGVVWKYFRDNHPDINLYVEDDSHPSIIGSYITACVYYTIILKKSPKAISYHHNALDTSKEKLVTEAVHDIVYSQLSDWQF